MMIVIEVGRLDFGKGLLYKISVFLPPSGTKTCELSEFRYECYLHLLRIQITLALAAIQITNLCPASYFRPEVKI